MDQPNANFPQKLFSLMESEPSDVVCWSERGLSFRVVNQDKFAEEIVPKYFRHTKMTSFQRQLNLYGFRRVTKGEDVGSYYHPKFQKGRRDLVPEIKRLPGKSSSSYHDEKSKAGLSLPSESRFTPGEGNVVEVMGTNNKPLIMSKLTMKMAGIQEAAIIPPQILSSIVPPQLVTPAYVSENAVQFLPMASEGNLGRNLFLPTVCLSREVVENPPPLLQRNFSVSSTFDEEYRLPIPSDDLIRSVSSDTMKPTSDTQDSAHPSSASSQSTVIALNEKPSLPVREESESWVKLGALDQLHDMDPFDIDTVFE